MNRTKSIKKGTKTAKKTISASKKQKALKKTNLQNIIKEKRSTLKKRGSHKQTRNKKNISAKKHAGFIKRKAMLSNKKKKVVTAKAAKGVSSTIAKPVRKSKIVRIMGQGQFTVDNETLKKLNEIDSSIVQLVSSDRSDDTEFRKRLLELTNIVEKNGKPLDSKEIVQSDIILPSADLSIDEAKNLFKGEGVVPEL